MTRYFAYGSNLWRQQMAERCPDHQEIGPGVLRGYRWIITTRGYASVVPSPGDIVHGTVYLLSAADEESLDRCEGVEQGAYRKELLTVEMGGRDRTCLVYVDPVEDEGRPREEYAERLRKGFADAGLPGDYAGRCLGSAR